jgi:hypothetical protein
MGKKFACIKYFSTPGSQDGVASLSFTSKTLEINLAAIKLKIPRSNGKAKRLEITAQLISQWLCGD